jgi:DNA-binding MarR family transcriptional regulator
VKQLFKSLPHSTTAIRYHYTRFINDGWIEAYSNIEDKRVKFVRPTQKFIEIINAYTKAAEPLLLKK